MNSPTSDLFDTVRALEHDARLFADRDAAILRKANPMFRNTDPETSIAAAAMAAKRAPSGRMIALTLLAANGSLTDFELARLSGIAQTSIGCRRNDLVRAGMACALRDSLNRIVTRPAPSGCQSIVWTLTDAGREFLRGQV